MLPRDAQGLVDDRLWYGQARGRRLCFTVGLCGVAVGGGLAVGARRDGRVVADVFEDAAEEVGEGGYLSGAEEGEGVGLDGGWPVG